ncbi:InlB B-repeat-containing protein [Prosthecodimorpha hirschii]|uniref:InlB B-repeat-containing protein n=1 Tax=Prosthecodimorpha hirschii TaxID=665126 RepID=UPI0015E4343E|nr:M12 family metallo-peptidase [Prosthecomicrobium hirschii]
MLKWMLGLIIAAALAGTATAAEPSGKALSVRYLSAESATVQARNADPAMAGLKGKKSVRYFQAGASLPVDTQTDTIDFGSAIGKLTLKSTEKRSNDDLTWVGKLDGRDGRAILVVRKGAITGTITSDRGNFDIRPVGNGTHAIIERDVSAFPPEHPPGALPRSNGGIDPKAKAATKGSLTYIDILVAYNTAAKNAYGSDMDAYAQLAVDTANTAYSDSGVDARLRLAGTIETSYSGTDFNTALDDVTNGTGGLGPVNTKREALGADLVSFMFNGTAYCGLGWLNSSSTSAYSVVYWDCAVSNHSFEHEIGHNFGARHDPYVDSSTTPYAYGHGYVYQTSWRTIMAYVNACGSCPRIGRFSNPNLTYNSVATGTAQTHDNARVHNERAATMAAFKTPATTYALSVSKTGNGTVTSSPSGINCGSTCSANFTENASVTLTAAASTGATFSTWGGACSGSSTTCTVTMSAAKSVTATFVATQISVSVSKNGTGAGSVTSSPSGIDCGATCSTTFAYATSVTLTAAPDNASVFGGWSGSCAGTSTTCTLSADAAKSVIATFTNASDPQTLTVAKSGTGSGTVTSSPSGISCGATCSSTFTTNTSVTLTAVAANGSSFSAWGGACSGSSATCTVTMSAARSVTATFNTSNSKVLVAVTKTGSGTGTVTSNPSGINCGSTCSMQVNTGTSVTLTATVGKKTKFKGWSGGCTGKATTCTFTASTDKSVTANFAKK